MKKIIHKANTRGLANHGWLKSYHTFSFASYQNPERMNFGMLRVLNDDLVQPKMGFGTHPHRNMEIISIPISGALSHKDSMGNKKTCFPLWIKCSKQETILVRMEFENKLVILSCNLYTVGKNARSSKTKMYKQKSNELSIITIRYIHKAKSLFPICF